MYPSTPPSGHHPPSLLSDRWVRCTLPPRPVCSSLCVGRDSRNFHLEFATRVFQLRLQFLASALTGAVRAVPAGE
ncbi:hypothetical protein CgunFtcFv8_016664 [Champsocephalus gunnari]|uniref:Uncharacterized protein n=1 Tax=Champsocephalus gunnari TaxID=52237 RepID=A0AAN8CUG7_CHAGU|nr:hypothetical protein CgunFtcFv8_016664 [Champsocephalus gunnari]